MQRRLHSAGTQPKPLQHLVHLIQLPLMNLRLMQTKMWLQKVLMHAMTHACK